MDHLDDLYDILGVPPDATAEELHHARNRMLRYWHPDRSLDPLAPERAKRINAAYDVLADPERRAVYDQHRASRLRRLDPGLNVTPPPAAPPPAAPPAAAPPAASSWTETPWDAGQPPGHVAPGAAPGGIGATGAGGTVGAAGSAWAPGAAGAAWSGGAADAAAVSAAGAASPPDSPVVRSWSREHAGVRRPGDVEALSRPGDRNELLDRARRALPFAAGALLLWLVAPLISTVAPPWVLTLWVFASLFGVGAAVRALLRRPQAFRSQGWERFGAAWLAGSGAFVVVWQLVVMPLGPQAPLGLVDVLLLAAFLAGVGGVYLAWRR